MNHAQIAPLLALAIITVFNGACKAETIAVRASAETHCSSGVHACLGMVYVTALTITVPYCYIAMHRILSGGLAVFAGDAIVYYLAAATDGLAVYPEWLAHAVPGQVFRMGFVCTTLLELSSPVVLLSGRWLKIWVPSILLFHAGTAVLMNILFWENMLLIAAVFGWPLWIGTGIKRRPLLGTADHGVSQAQSPRSGPREAL